MHATCSIDGCGKKVLARGWCNMHYLRWYRYGDPLKVHIPEDAIARFWSKVDRRDDDECWPWLGGLAPHGYGVFGYRGTTVAAHRFAFKLMVGPIPDGMTIDHIKARGCTRRDCMNALRHMEPVTIRENVLRSDGITALNARKTHCLRGHEFTPENTVQLRAGGRRCRACNREHTRERRRVRHGSI